MQHVFMSEPLYWEQAPWRVKKSGGSKHTPMASVGTRAYNGGVGAVDEVFVFKTVIFNASATVFARNDVLFELLLL